MVPAMKFSVSSTECIVVRWTLSLPPDNLLESEITHMSVVSIGSSLNSQFQAFGEGSFDIPTESKIQMDQSKWKFKEAGWLAVTIPKETGYSF
jgi:hypothetical protein